jgi:hypothetical protein
MSDSRTRRYRVRRISLFSLLRMSLALGWLVALGPALCLAALGVRALQAAGAALGKVENIEVGAFGQTLARIDLLQTLGLSSAAETTGQLTANAGATFVTFALVLVLVGALLLAVGALLFGLGYNLLAWLGGGVEVELRQEN